MAIKTLIPKSESRKIVIQRRQEIGGAEINRKTLRIIKRLEDIDEFRYSKVVHCYVASRPGEVDTKTLIDHMVGQGKSVILPKLNSKTKSFRRFHFMGWDSLIKNCEGYWEPKLGTDEDLSDIDLFIVPTLAISSTGYRVGYGRGYYDKLLSKSFAPKISLAFEFQIFEYIEIHQHDVRIDKIVTEMRIIETREN
jgi:5-formyltetrahydrofolate cyclo-ligase